MHISLDMQVRNTLSHLQLIAITPLALVHALGNLFTNLSLGKVAVSFTHTIKAMEPFFSVLLSSIFLGDVSDNSQLRGSEKPLECAFNTEFRSLDASLGIDRHGSCPRSMPLGQEPEMLDFFPCSVQIGTLFVNIGFKLRISLSGNLVSRDS